MHWISYLFGAGAALLMGFSKTGMPGAAMPAVALMAEAFHDETKLSVGAMLPILITGDVLAIYYYRRHAQWHRLWQLLPYVAVGMVPGYLVLWLIDSDDSDPLRSLLGWMILALLALHLLWDRFGKDRMPEYQWFVMGAGALAGFGTTVGNAAGPVMSIFLLSCRLDKHEFLGTAAWFFLVVNLSKIPFFLLLGMITPTTLRFDVLLAPALVLGVIAGVALLKWIPQTVFDLLVLGLAAIAGLRLVIS